MRISGPAGRPLVAPTEEIFLGTAPELTPIVSGDGLRRANAFAGRALSAAAMLQEQQHRSVHLSAVQRMLSPGVVEGLGLAFSVAADGVQRLYLEAGPGLTAGGSASPRSIACRSEPRVTR